MAPLRNAAVLLLVAALVLQATAAPAPQPGFGKWIKKTANKVATTLKEKYLAIIQPGLNCLGKAGLGDMGMNYLKDCGTSKYYGKTALLACAGTEYAPSDVKAVAKSSSKCFKL